MQAALVLENGKIFYGESFGESGEAWGEIVFNTGMTGYQEALTDPSYAGQLICMTYPLIGNYGINRYDNQSSKIQVKGFIVKEAAKYPHHWQMEKTLSHALAQEGVVGIKCIDTRALTRMIREHGTLKGVITTNTQEEHLQDLLRRLQDFEPDPHVVAMVSTKEVYTLPGNGQTPEALFHVVVMDFGIKANILGYLQKKGFNLTVVPYNTTADEIMKLKPDGIFLSNGPGNPKVLTEAIATVSRLVDKYPIFGICLGHQILSLACGGDTYKLKFGHRGGNHPVQDLRTRKVVITSQNHGYAVAAESLENTPLRVTHLNLNDHTVEGVEHIELPVFSVQYHPEAGPGPGDSVALFDRFAFNMQQRRVNHAT